MLKNKLNQLSNSFVVDGVVAVLALITLGYLLLSSPGIEGQYDLNMYHAYNGWAGVNNIDPITGQFFHPAYTHTYFANYIDIIQWLILDNFTALNASIVLGVIQLTVLVPLYFINTQLFNKYSKLRNFSISVLSLSAANFVVQIGGYSGDIISSIPVLFAFWLMLKYLVNDSFKYVALSALLFGISLTLKLTNAGYILFFSAFLIYVLYKKKWIHVILFSLISLAAFTVTLIPQFIKTLNASNGKNPFFPNYNNIFKAESFPEISYSFDMLKTKPSDLGTYLYNQFVNSLSHDFRVSASLAAAVIVILVALFFILQKKFTHLHFRTLTFVGLFLATYILYALLFGTERYYMVLSLLMIPVILLAQQMISENFAAEYLLERIYKYFATILSAALLFTVNPAVFMPYSLNNSKEMFSSTKIPELEKYDAVIVTGPMHMSWLAVITRDYVKESGQAWLSSAFNRADAKKAEPILAGKNNVGYIVQSHNQVFAAKNLATLGYTTSDKCNPIDFEGYYGEIYNTFVACDAVYTGIYKYELKPEEKIVLGENSNPTTNETINLFKFKNYR